MFAVTGVLFGYPYRTVSPCGQLFDGRNKYGRIPYAADVCYHGAFAPCYRTFRFIMQNSHPRVRVLHRD